MKKHRPSIINNNRGNTIVASLLVMTVIVTGVYFGAQKLLSERKVNAELKKNISVNLSLRSVTDYVKYGIRKGWCFDGSLLPDSADLCAGSFTHARSTWRLLMPKSYEDTLKYLATRDPSPIPALPGGDLHLNSFEVKIDLNSLGPSHPLFKILSNLNRSVLKYVNVKCQRLTDGTLPVTGDEVYIQVTVEFLDDKSAPIQDGASYYREVSKFLATPREVNSFALLLAGNLYLAPPSPPVADAGHGYVSAGKTTDVGLNFESPIFVNGNIHINKAAYAPVTFSDVVVLGNGAIRDTAGAPYKFGDSLGLKKFWSETSQFGGFLSGFDTDSKRDEGLDVLAGIVPSKELKNDVIQKCIDLIRSTSSLDLTDKSVLTARKLSGNTTLKYTNRYSFSKTLSVAQNVFVPQKLSKQPSDGSPNTRIRAVHPAIDLSAHRFAMWLEVEWLGEKFRVPLMETAEGVGLGYAIGFSPFTANEIIQSQKDAKDAQLVYDKEKKDYEVILASEPPVSSAGHVTWEKKRDDAKTVLDAAKAKFDKLDADYFKQKEYYDNPGIIKINTVQPKLTFTKPMSPFREVTVEIVNPDHFVKPKSNFSVGPYQVVSPDYLSIEAMDVSALNGVTTRKGQPDFNMVFHAFSTDAGGVTALNELYKRDMTTIITAAPADESIDYESFKENCYSGTAGGGGINLDSFKPAGWTADFTDVAVDSWHFAAEDKTIVPEVISSDSTEYRIRATRSVCTITSTAKFVSGFWVCQKLVIADRTDPLEIIGTFIVSRDLTIHPNAIKAGITWSNIHNQLAVRRLKAKAILHRADNSNCDTLPVPYWHPDPGLPVLADRLRCSSTFLLQGVNPPRWTSVDPDCGRLNPTDANTQCMKRIRNFNLIQLERIYGPKD